MRSNGGRSMAPQSEPFSSKGVRTEDRTENNKTAVDENEQKQLPKVPEFVLTEIRTLEGVSYYHGMVARDVVESKLARCGDYLVRATDHRIAAFEFILSVFNKKRIHGHLTIKGDIEAKRWHLGIFPTNKFPSVIDLVNFFKTNPIGVDFYLKRAISKAKHLISHDRIKYNPKTDLLGSGNFSDVFIGQMELENGSVKVALKNSKKLNDLLDPEKNKEASKAKKEMIQEAEVMSQLRHANITALFGMSTDRLPILIVIEFCIGGTLLGHIKKHGANISHQERMIYIHDTSAGLKYIHSMSITHRDIAARNCLISVNGFVKLSDFGMGLKIGQSVSSTNLPYRWMAPELFQARAKFSKASDVWAFGILIYEIFSNATRPFFDVEDDEVRALVKSGKHPPIPPSVGQFMTQIMEQVFKLSATDRITGELFHNKVHAHCVENNLLKFQDLTLNKIEGVHRERSEHWDEYVPQVITLDKNGNEKGWGNAPEEMLANVVWRK